MADEQNQPTSDADESVRPGGKSQFLHREEIRSMEKDIGKVREQEVQKERVRIAQIQKQQQTQREQQLSEQIRQKAQEQQVQQKQKDIQQREQQMRDEAKTKEQRATDQVTQQ